MRWDVWGGTCEWMWWGGCGKQQDVSFTRSSSSVLQCVAVWCSVLQCVAVCCSVLHVWRRDVRMRYRVNEETCGLEIMCRRTCEWDSMCERTRCLIHMCSYTWSVHIFSYTWTFTCSPRCLIHMLSHSYVLLGHLVSFTCSPTHEHSHVLRGGGLGSRPQKMYGERLGDGVEYHLMKPTPRR